MNGTDTVLAVSGWLAAAILIWLRLRMLTRLDQVAHELRGPLAALRLSLFRIGSVLRDEAVQEQVKGLDLHIDRACLAVEDLVYEGKLRSGHKQKLPGSFDIAIFIKRVICSWQPVAEFAGVTLSLSLHCGPLTISGSRQRLAQALSNMLANAIERCHSQVTVNVTKDGEAISIAVDDDGPGLSALPAARRLGRSRRGHGLALARSVATTHGGAVEAVQSKRGACISLKLPLHELKEEAA